MNYDQILSLLQQRKNLELQATAEKTIFDLQNTHFLLQSLKIKKALSLPSLHITGSVGKGSVALLVQSIFTAQNISVGLYLSPHLRHIRERILLGGKAISQGKFSYLAGKVFQVSKGEESFFEILTALAFFAFEREKIQLAIWEVGMGGARDATNLNPSHLALFTPIEKEHLPALGATLKDLAREKSGIIKDSTRVVISAVQTEEVAEILEQRARQKKAEFLLEGRDFLWTFQDGQIFLEGQSLPCPFWALSQQQNTGLAYLAVQKLSQMFGFSIENSPNWSNLSLPGRMDIRETSPTVIFDTAHTPLALKSLLESLDQAFPQSKKFVVFGLLRDKNAPAMVSLLEAHAHWLAFCTAPSPRAFRAGELAKMAQKKWEIFDQVDHGLAKAKALAHSRDVVVLTGSHSMVGPRANAPK